MLPENRILFSEKQILHSGSNRIYENFSSLKEICMADVSSGDNATETSQSQVKKRRKS